MATTNPTVFYGENIVITTIADGNLGVAPQAGSAVAAMLGGSSIRIDTNQAGYQGTISLEISDDGTNWFQFGGSIVNSGAPTTSKSAAIQSLNGSSFNYVRINQTAYTAGSCTVKITSRRKGAG